jgi:CrcB protein
MLLLPRAIHAVPACGTDPKKRSHVVRLVHGNEVSQNRLSDPADDLCQFDVLKLRNTRQTMSYLWVTVGSALGGLLRFIIGKLAISYDLSMGFPVGTVLINVIGSFVIGYFGTLTLHGGKYPVSENMRLFVMVGVCGGFTTFSSFSLQTFDLARSGAWGRALVNVVLSVVLCLTAVAAGHRVAQRSVQDIAIAETAEEEFTG